MFYISRTSIYFIGFIILPLLFFGRSKLIDFNNNMLNKKTTNIIKGASILAIILCHISQQMIDSGRIISVTYANIGGYLSVGLFFLCSGYGLTISKNSNINYFDNFISKRIVKVYIPFVIINLIYLILNVILYDNTYKILDVILLITGVNLIDGVYWFVIVIVLFYLLYYFLFKYLEDNIANLLLFLIIIVACLLMYLNDVGKWWYISLLCFPVGVYLSINIKKIFLILNLHYFKILISTLILFLISTLIGGPGSGFISLFFRTISSICFSILFIVIIFKVRLTSDILEFMGKISYEIYLIHKLPIFFDFILINLNGKVSVYIYLLIIIISAVLFKKINNKISILLI